MNLLACFRRRSRYTVTVFMSKDGWRFRAMAANHEILFQSEAYTRPGDAERAAKALCAAKLEFKHP